LQLQEFHPDDIVVTAGEMPALRLRGAEFEQGLKSVREN